MHHKPTLVVGIPRSGSTWLAKALANNLDVKYIHEPDNEKNNLMAYNAKRKLHRFPYLRKNDRNDLYYKLWDYAFRGSSFDNVILKKILPINKYKMEYEIGVKCGLIHKEFFRHTEYKDLKIFSSRLKNEAHFLIGFLLSRMLVNRKRHVVVKSVLNLLALEWIQKNFNVDIIIIVRHPANIISSYLELKMPDSIRNIFKQKRLVHDYFEPNMKHYNKATTIIEQMTFQIGAFYYFLEHQLQRNPNWVLIKHEDLCLDPINNFKTLFKKINFNWDSNIEEYLKKHNQKGEGFSIYRDMESLAYKYKKNLTESQIKRIKKYYILFSNRLYYDF